MPRRLVLAAALSTTVFFPFAAGAIDGYIGAGPGYGRFESEDFLDANNDLRDDRTIWQAYAGFRFVPYLGVEAHYVDFGEAGDNGFILDSNGAGASLGLHLPVSERFTLSARAGQLWWEADASIGDLEIDASTDGEDPFYGIGAHFGADEGVGLNLRYDRYEMNELDIDVPSINLELGF